MSKPNIILIGKMASGKSHVAKFLRDKHKYEILSLAHPIKEIEHYFHQFEDNAYPNYEYADDVWHSLGAGKVIDNELFWKFIKILEEELPKIERESPKPRKRLQFIGTDLGRDQISPSLWLDIALKSIEKRSDSFVVDDVRFENEYWAFEKAGFRPIKLIVSSGMQQKRLEVLYDLSDEELSLRINHVSEIELDRISIDEKNCVNADQNLITMYEEVESKLGLK